MERLHTITKYLDEFFEIRNVKDISWNGLQFEGTHNVEMVVFAVDAGIETFEKAADENADLIIVHHGLFWKYSNPSICGINKLRTNILFKKNIALYACHVPLDIHGNVGNNVGLLRMLGASPDSSISKEINSILVTGLFKTPHTFDDIVEMLNTALHTKCITLPFGKQNIRKIGVITGSCGYSDLSEAIGLNLDLLVTGECTEVYHIARDAGINIIFAGHHATETVGIKLLMELLTEKFNITSRFLDIPTGL